MPQYDYKCRECQQAFSIFCGMNDSREDIKCEYCNSSNVCRVYNGIITKGKNITPDFSSRSTACGSCSAGTCSGCH